VVCEMPVIFAISGHECPRRCNSASSRPLISGARSRMYSACLAPRTRSSTSTDDKSPPESLARLRSAASSSDELATVARLGLTGLSKRGKVNTDERPRSRLDSPTEVVFTDEGRACGHAALLSQDDDVLAAGVVRFTINELGTRAGIALFVDGQRQKVPYVSDCRTIYSGGRKHH
jgi:hypothetical protein